MSAYIFEKPLIRGTMIKRKSQFTALVDINGEELTVHIPTTNRIGDVENKNLPFVLQATMRCLRAITDERLTATVFLSKENYDTLDDELHKNFNMEIKDIKNPSNADRHKYQVRVLPPPRTITLK